MKKVIRELSKKSIPKAIRRVLEAIAKSSSHVGMVSVPLVLEKAIELGISMGPREAQKAVTVFNSIISMIGEDMSEKVARRFEAGIKEQFNLSNEYARLNRAYFNGELPRIPLKWNKSRRSGGMATATVNRRTGDITPTGIKISTFLKMDEDRFFKILLHEMVHIWQFVNNVNDGHGSVFKQKAREVGSKAGIKIPLTEDITNMEISDDVKATEYVVALWGYGSLNRMSLFSVNAYQKYKSGIVQWLESKVSGGFRAEIVRSDYNGLMKLQSNRKVNRITSYKASPDEVNKIKSSGKVIKRIGDGDSGVGDEELRHLRGLITGVVKNTAARFQRLYGVRFDYEVAAVNDQVIAKVTSQYGGGLKIVAAPGKPVSVGVMKSGFGSFDTTRYSKVPTPATLEKLMRDTEEVFGDEFARAMGGEVRAASVKNADVKDVVKKIFRVFDKDKAMEIAERVVDFWRNKNPRSDLTPVEQRKVYRPVDYGDRLPLTRKRDVDINWTDHAEYRSDLRDVNPDQVNKAIRDRMQEQLNPPSKKKMRMKERGLGTMVVDFSTKNNPAQADVITVWGSESSDSFDIVHNLIRAAEEILDVNRRYDR